MVNVLLILKFFTLKMSATYKHSEQFLNQQISFEVEKDICFINGPFRLEVAAEGRIDSRACVVNMCVLGEKSCFRQNSVFHSIDF